MRCIMTLGVAAALLFAARNSYAQSWRPPAEEQRCPSKWGPDDQRGAGNHMKPATVLRATRLIQTGEVIELGHVLSQSMPLPGGRRFELHTKRTTMNPQANRRGSNEELVIAEIGQVGTQFDGFSHQTIGDRLYNCYELEETATRAGFRRLGVENVGTLITRGVLLDIAGLKGVEMLPARYEITIQDLQQAMQREGVDLQPGDAVIIHTGWGSLWESNDARYYGNCPGIGIAAAEWLVQQDPLLVGSDNWPVEVAPNPDPQLSLPVHQIMLVVHGIHLLENLKLDELAAQRAYEFALILQPLKLQGGTGSTVAPVAVR